MFSLPWSALGIAKVEVKADDHNIADGEVEKEVEPTILATNMRARMQKK